jgi:hypothetical protein
MKRTLVKFTLLAVFDGPQDDDYLATIGDQLAETVRGDTDLISVSSEFDSVEGDVPDDDENLIVRFALLQHKRKQTRPARRKSRAGRFAIKPDTLEPKRNR